MSCYHPQLGGGGGGELALEAPHRGARGADDDDEALALAVFHIDHAGEINARFPYQPAPQFQRESAAGQDRRPRLQSPAERYADRANVERGVAGEIGKPKTAAQIDERRRRADLLRQSRRQSDGGGLRIDDRLCVQILAARENMPAAPIRARVNDPARQRRRAVGVDAEGLGPAAHAHA